jgi:hypothetical protein
MPFWRCLAMFALWLTVAVPARAQTVSLLNGSQLSMTGLNLIVSNCALVVAGWQQATCAAGNLVLQAMSGDRNTVSYQLAYNGSGSSALSNVAQVGGENLFQLSFDLGVTTNQPGSKVSAATLTTIGAGSNCSPFCGADITTHQSFSAAAGGNSFTSSLLTSPSVHLILAQANSFTIKEVITLTPAGQNQYMDRFNPDTLNLGSVRETFATVPEPSAIALLLTAMASLALARSRRGRTGE